MLPTHHLQAYRDFQQMLQTLKHQLNHTHLEPTAWQSTFLKAQKFFQVQILGLDLNGLSPDQQSRVKSYQTEMNKQLRLLSMDVTFLQAARQSITAQQRQAHMKDRISLLLGYCEALL
ncbi:MAG: heterocyst frequency control protein PatD [Cyanothece sp. SIO1E1]|nr:heterocyst frequency control protein PatD [Cyanothece sp. SIO1E1]